MVCHKLVASLLIHKQLALFGQRFFVNVSLAESFQILYNKKELYKSSFKC